MKCPSCEGEKRIMALVKYADKPCEYTQINCSTCLGTGEITEEHWKRIERGKVMREDRLRRSLSQSEEAKRLGMTHIAYSKLEHGKV